MPEKSFFQSSSSDHLGERRVDSGNGQGAAIAALPCGADVVKTGADDVGLGGAGHAAVVGA